MAMQNPPKPSSKRQPESEPETFAEALRLIQEDAHAKGVDKLTMEEIDAEIAAVRREEQERQSGTISLNEGLKGRR